jgi:hypothetical protein
LLHLARVGLAAKRNIPKATKSKPGEEATVRGFAQSLCESAGHETGVALRSEAMQLTVQEGSMPYVRVHVDAEDILEDLSDQELRDELSRRQRKNGKGNYHSADFSIPQQVAKYTLDEASGILRKQGRVDLAFKLDEIKVDFVGH